MGAADSSTRAIGAVGEFHCSQAVMSSAIPAANLISAHIRIQSGGCATEVLECGSAATVVGLQGHILPLLHDLMFFPKLLM